MKMPRLLRRKKLRASAARRSLANGGVDYEEMSEPNMKLSRALLIVLVLHIVAVAGIIAFNAIKTRQGGLPPLPVTKSANAKVDETAVANATGEKQAATSSVEEKPKRPAVAREETKTEKPKHSTKATVADSGKTYVVVKGDNPVTISRKFKVSYDSLLELNHIDDPKKLKIGQKLLIPAKTMKSKKSEEDK
jgi:LysM repeat protein